MAQQPLFTVAEAARLADMKPATINLWLRDGLIGTSDDRRAAVAGVTSFLSVDTVFALAMAAWLRKLGAHPTIACKAGTSLAEMKGPYEPNAPVATKPITYCAFVTTDGEAGFISKDGVIDTAEVQDGAWILPYERIAKNVLDAAWNRRPGSDT